MTKPRTAAETIERMRNVLAFSVQDVGPASPQLDRADIRGADLERGSDKLVPSLVGANGSYVRIRQNRVGVRLSARNAVLLQSVASRIPLRLTASRKLISDVVVHGSPSEMRRIATRRIIARVQRERLFTRSRCNIREREAVSQMRAPFATGVSRHELPVAVTEAGLPRPAFVRPTSINFAVKPLAKHLYELPTCSATFKGA